MSDDFKGILEGFRDMMENKLNCMVEVIYNDGMERYGVGRKPAEEKQGQAKSRPQVET